MPPWSPIELLPVEVAHAITRHLHPQWLSHLMSASRVLHRLFAPSDADLPFIRQHLVHHFGHDLASACQSAKDIPFWNLPDVFAVAWLASCWECMEEGGKGMHTAMTCMVVAFSDLEIVRHKRRWCKLEFKHGPRRPVAWMERIVLKTLQLPDVRIRFAPECLLAFNLAALVDSVEVVETVLGRLFPKVMKAMDTADSAAGARQVVVSVDMHWPRQRPLDANDHRRDSFAWCMASVAEEAASKGAIHVLNYALQHPLVPVAFSYARRFRQFGDTFEFLVNCASRRAHIHVVHCLLGNPLPLAPPPASRPLRPGNPSDLDGFQPTYLRKARTQPVLFSRDNPVATLTQLGFDTEPPLQNLLGFEDHDPLRAATYLLDQGAPVHRNLRRPAHAGPLYRAAHRLHAGPEVLRLLLERGADVNDRLLQGPTALHCVAQRNHAACAEVLIEAGADLDATTGEGHWFWHDDILAYTRSTPLRVALVRRSYEVARVLVGAGATMMERGCYRGHMHLKKRLREQLLRGEALDVTPREILCTGKATVLVESDECQWEV
ncbi:Glycerophosphocholine phosphodiesterase [Phlyctochytrium bullatum]|nr:Glycerophosphocholine phosphodiesterase [Phlyctochytrium bullatum]